IPSRVILKESLDERFEIFKTNGIFNLKDLIAALKPRQKAEAFSNRTGLPINYLTILLREVGSYLPNPVPLAKFPGIDFAYLEHLVKQRIKNTKQLFERATTNHGVSQLSQATAIPLEKLNELVSLSDLARLYGVGPVFARIIYDAGITSVKAFAECGAHAFMRMYEEKTHKKADFRIEDIEFSLELARELTSVV
ncbi:MAG: DUF4332 domain-containing protein, partial [Spirochaetales bacterium]|nr:DUF4332 domain-containing protein [Spirochaetales bacterium]